MLMRPFALSMLLLVSLAGSGSGSESNGAQPSAANAVLPGARPEIDARHLLPRCKPHSTRCRRRGSRTDSPGHVRDFCAARVVTERRLDSGSRHGHAHQNVNVDGQPALVVKHPDGDKVKADDQLWRVMLSNFRITGNEKSGHGIEALLVNEIFIQGVTVSYHGESGIRLDRCYEDPRVSGCLITYNKQTGLDLPGCHDIVVSANQFEENRDAVHCFDSFNLCFTGNCVDDHLGDGVVIENTYGSVLSGNMIEECDGRAIVLARDCYGITLSANVIAHNGGGIDLVDAHGCAVSANTFVLLKPPAKTQDGTQPMTLDTRCVRVASDSSRIAITGNSFCDSYIGEGATKRKAADQLAGGIVLEGTSDVAIIGNTFSSVPKAVEVREPASRRVLFSNNVLIEAPSDHEKLPK